jgi:hypothetical protein
MVFLNKVDSKAWVVLEELLGILYDFIVYDCQVAGEKQDFRVLEESRFFQKFGPATVKIVNMLFGKVSGDEKEDPAGIIASHYLVTRYNYWREEESA